MINEKPLSTVERNNLDDKEFGIPELRAYPLNDKSHVEQAVRMFNHVDPEYEKELADNLNKAIKKFGLSIEVGNDNRFKKYVKESRVMSREQNISAVLEGLNNKSTSINEGYGNIKVGAGIEKVINKALKSANAKNFISVIAKELSNYMYKDSDEIDNDAAKEVDDFWNAVKSAIKGAENGYF